MEATDQIALFLIQQGQQQMFRFNKPVSLRPASFSRLLQRAKAIRVQSLY